MGTCHPANVVGLASTSSCQDTYVPPKLSHPHHSGTEGTRLGTQSLLCSSRSVLQKRNPVFEFLMRTMIRQTWDKLKYKETQFLGAHRAVVQI